MMRMRSIVWHFYHVIFDPDVYPVNFAFLDGKVSEELYREEHELDFERSFVFRLNGESVIWLQRGSVIDGSVGICHILDGTRFGGSAHSGACFNNKTRGKLILKKRNLNFF